MKLSYIIPLYNAEPFIGQCLDSVLDCDLDKSQFEVIVVDDGSTDDGLSVAQEYARRYSNIRVFHQENQGQSVARNLGIKEAKGDYIWFVDSDDYVDATQISPLLEMMIRKKIEMCKFEAVVFKQDGTSRLSNSPLIIYNRVYQGEQLLLNDVPFGAVWNRFFSRQFIEANSLTFYPGIINEDAEFSVRAIALAQRVIYVNRHIYKYRYNANSCTRSNDYEHKLKSQTSDVIIARNIRRFCKNESNLSLPLLEFLENFATSIIKGKMITYLTKRDADSIKLYDEFVAEACKLGEYPIRFKKRMVKDFLIGLILNNDNFMTKLIRLRNM